MRQLPFVLLASLGIGCLSSRASAAAVTGRLATEASEPVAGARVELVLPATVGNGAFDAVPGVSPPDVRVVAAAATDEQGVFSLSPGDDQTWPADFPAFRVERPDCAAITLADVRVATAGPLPQDVHLTVTKATCRVQGLVLDERGRPAGGVAVGLLARVTSGFARDSVTTRADGTFTSKALPCPSSVTAFARRDDGALGRGTTALVAGDARMAIHLDPSLALSGRLVEIRSGETVGLAHARIAIRSRPPSGTRGDWLGDGWDADRLLGTVTTDAEGRWSARVPRRASLALVEPAAELADVGPGTQVVTRRPPSAGVVTGLDRTEPQPSAAVMIEGHPSTLVGVDASGRYALPLPAGAAALIVEARGHLGSRRFPLPPSGRGTDGSPRVVSASCRGVVRGPDREDGNPGDPVAGALVLARSASRPLVLSATDETGRFRIDGLPRGLVSVTARAGGRVASFEGRAGSDVTLVLGGGTNLTTSLVEVKGELREALGGGALVIAEPAGADQPRLLRAGGSLVLPALAPGRWTVQGVGATGAFGSATTTLGVRAVGAAVPAEARLDVPFVSTGRLAVTCVDGSGAPVAGAIVLARKDRWFVAASGPDGRATIEGLPAGSCYAWLVMHPAFADGAAPDCVVVAAGATTEARSILLRPATLTVRVADPDGAPVAGASVALLDDTSVATRPVDAGGALSRGTPTMTTAQDGVANFRSLSPGTVIVRAGAAGWLQATPVPVELASGTDAVIDMALGRGATIDGRVVDPSGVPAKGATVSVEMDQAQREAYFPWPEASVGDDGRFRIGGLLADAPVTLTARRDGDVSPPRRVIAGKQGDTEVLLTLVARGRIVGRVLRDGEGIAAGVSCGDPQVNAQSADDGSFEVAGLAPGLVTCTATATGYGMGRAEDIAVDAGPAPASATIVLQDARDLRLHVTKAADGSPIAGARASGAGIERTLTDETGTALLRLAPWTTSGQMWIWADGYSQQQVPIPQAQATLEVRMTAAVSVKGRVLAADGTPALGATVNGGHVDGDARFSVTAQPGPLRLFALRAQGGEREEASQTVEVPAEGLRDLTLSLKALETGALRVLVAEEGVAVPSAPVRVLSEAMGGDATRWGQEGMWYSTSESRLAQAMGTTDAAGLFSAEMLPPGAYAILVARPGEPLLGRAASARVMGGETTEITVAPPGRRRISGRVTRSGEPVEGASVQLQVGMENTMRFGVSRTEPDGTFTVGPLPDSLDTVGLFVAPPQPALPDDLRQATTFVRLGADPPPIEIDLTGVTLAGTVTAGGAAVRDAMVELRPRPQADRPAFPASVASARTREDGAYVLRGLPPGTAGDVTASLPPWIAATESVQLPASGAASLDLVLRDSGRLSGVASTSDGPVTGTFTLLLQRGDGALLRPVTPTPDDRGAFTLDVPGDAAYRYRATLPGFAPARGVIEAGDGLVLRFTRGARLDLTVTDAGGDALQGATASLIDLDGEPVGPLLPASLTSGFASTSTASDAAGRMSLAALAPGTYRIRVTQGDSTGEVGAVLAEGQRMAAAVRVD